MHKIHAKEFELSDFSTEHLLSFISDGDERAIPRVNTTDNEMFSPFGSMECIIVPMLNNCRELYLATKDKKYWHQMIQLLPSSYNQKRTVMLNYEVLVNIYKWRRDHKLDEWHTFCDWIESLPYAELITGVKKDD